MPLQKLKAWGGHVTNGQILTIIFWDKYEILCPFSQADGPSPARPSCGKQLGWLGPGTSPINTYGWIRECNIKMAKPQLDKPKAIYIILSCHGDLIHNENIDVQEYIGIYWEILMDILTKKNVTKLIKTKKGICKKLKTKKKKKWYTYSNYFIK